MFAIVVLTIVCDGFDDLAFLEQAPAGAAGLAGFEVLDPLAAAQLIRRIPPWELSSLRGVLGRQPMGDPFGQHGDALDELSALVRAGVVVVARREVPQGGLGPEGEATDLADLAEPTSAEPKPVETFAAFRLVDDGGKPIPDQAFTLDLPDGRTLDGTTGPDGRFDVDPVAARGNCVLRFAKAS